VSAVVGTPLLLFKDVQWRDFHTSEAVDARHAIIRGIADRGSALILFGGLFSAADGPLKSRSGVPTTALTPAAPSSKI